METSAVNERVLAMTPVDVTRALWTGSRSGDLVRIRSLIADDIRSAIHLPQEVLFAGGGMRVGSAAFFDRLRTFSNAIETVDYVPHFCLVNGPYVRTRVVGAVRHRASGQIYEGAITQEMKIENGKLVHLDVYYDTPKLRAFMAYASWSYHEAHAVRPH
jgi:ketosteroid isomerase-like protein